MNGRTSEFPAQRTTGLCENIQYHGFAWQPEDFNRWLPVEDYADERLARKHQRTGWGVPLVIVRQREADERFMTRSLPFSATVLLRPATNARPGADPLSAPHVLEVFNPLAVKKLPKDDGQTTPLAADLSAPIAWLNQNSPHLNYQAFLHPDRQHVGAQLIMLEPYQASKIPVIFVHGLLSDPLTWTGLINELRASDWFNERYQVWLFGYAIHPFFAKHIPTSVDMLEPQDPVLQAMRRLPVAPHVRLHSVIGNGHPLLVGGPADGVVPVSSARHDRVDSEALVPATHQHLQTHPDTVQEVLRILMLHLL